MKKENNLKWLLTFIFALLLFASEAQIKQYQIKEPEKETSDSLLYFMSNIDGYWRIGKGILDTSKVFGLDDFARKTWVTDKNYLISSDLSGIRDSTLANSGKDTTGIYHVNRGLLDAIDVTDTTWWGTQPYVPTLLTEFDSTGFDIDTSQVRDLKLFVENNGGSDSPWTVSGDTISPKSYPVRIDTMIMGETILSEIDGKYIIETRSNLSSDNLYLSNDNGETFSPVGNSRDWMDVEISEDGLVIVGYNTGGYIETSTDGGSTWSIYSANSATGWIGMSANGQYMYANCPSASKFYYSSNYGASWAYILMSNIFIVNYSKGFDTHPTGQYVMFAASGAPIKWSNNYGQSFSDVGGSYQWRDHAFSDSTIAVSVVSSSTGTGVHKSNNYGQSWSYVSGSSFGGGFVGIDINLSGRYSVAASNTEIIVSDDYANSYDLKKTKSSSALLDLSMDGSGRQTIIVYSDSIFYSEDYGLNWSKVENTRGAEYLSMNKNTSTKNINPYTSLIDDQGNFRYYFMNEAFFNFNQYGKVGLKTGAYVDGISNDPNLIDASQTDLVTEYAVKTAIDNIETGTSSTGEANTASNINQQGVGVFYQKSGVDLQFLGIREANNKLSVSYNSTYKTADITVNESNFTELKQTLSFSSPNLTISNGNTVDLSALDGSSMTYPSTTGLAYYDDVAGTWGTSITDNSTNWNTAYNDKINSIAVTGTDTKTVTLTQQDGTTLSDTFTDLQGSGGGATNLTTSTTSTSVTINSDTGTDAPINSATTTVAGVMSASDKTTLDGVATTGSTTQSFSAQQITLPSSWVISVVNGDLQFSNGTVTMTINGTTGEVSANDFNAN